MNTPEGFRFVFIHKACGQPTFYFKVRPMRGEIVKSGGVVFPNGEPVKPGEQMTCGIVRQGHRISAIG